MIAADDQESSKSKEVRARPDVLAQDQPKKVAKKGKVKGKSSKKKKAEEPKK